MTTLDSMHGLEPKKDSEAEPDAVDRDCFVGGSIAETTTTAAIRVFSCVLWGFGAL